MRYLPFITQLSTDTDSRLTNNKKTKKGYPIQSALLMFLSTLAETHKEQKCFNSFN